VTSASDFAIVRSGIAADVRLSAVVWREYKKVRTGTDEKSIKRNRQLMRYFAEFCDHEPHRLTVEQFKKQGNFTDGMGGKVPIWEFKPWQWRLYGAILTVGGKKCFVGVTVDTDKKKDLADRALLEAAAREISALSEYTSGKTTLGAKDGKQRPKNR
jgi:hypothetical protein